MTNRAALEAARRRGAPLARRPQQPGLRASRRLVEQRAARAGVLRRPHRRLSRRCAARPSGCSTTACATRSRRTCAASARSASSRGSSTSRSRTRGARRRSTGTASRSPPTGASRAPTATAIRARSSRPARGAARTRCARASTATPSARLVNLDGTVVAEARDEIARAARELGDVFVLDLDGRNRYVMTTATTLAPLLDLPRAQLELDGDTRAGTRAAVAAIGVVLAGDVVGQRARPAARRVAPGRRGDRGRRAGMPRLRALAPDGSAVDGLRLRRRPRRRWTGASAGRRGHPRRARAARGRRPEVARARASSTARTGPSACTRIYPRFVAGRVDVERMESDTWSFRADRCATPAVFTDGGGARDDASRARSARRASALASATDGALDLARLPLPRGAAALRRLADAGAARRADAPLAAGRARRARLRRARPRRPRAACCAS